MNDLPGAIQSYIDAYTRKDVAAMLECLSEDVTFCNISDGEVTTETCGKQAFAQLATSMPSKVAEADPNDLIPHMCRIRRLMNR